MKRLVSAVSVLLFLLCPLCPLCPCYADWQYQMRSVGADYDSPDGWATLAASQSPQNDSGVTTIPEQFKPTPEEQIAALQKQLDELKEQVKQKKAQKKSKCKQVAKAIGKGLLSSITQRMSNGGGLIGYPSTVQPCTDMFALQNQALMNQYLVTHVNPLMNY